MSEQRCAARENPNSRLPRSLPPSFDDLRRAPGQAVCQEAEGTPTPTPTHRDGLVGLTPADALPRALRDAQRLRVRRRRSQIQGQGLCRRQRCRHRDRGRSGAGRCRSARIRARCAHENRVVHRAKRDRLYPSSAHDVQGELAHWSRSGAAVSHSLLHTDRRGAAVRTCHCRRRVVPPRQELRLRT